MRLCVIEAYLSVDLFFYLCSVAHWLVSFVAFLAPWQLITNVRSFFNWPMYCECYGAAGALSWLRADLTDSSLSGRFFMPRINSRFWTRFTFSVIRGTALWCGSLPWRSPCHQRSLKPVWFLFCAKVQQCNMLQRHSLAITLSGAFFLGGYVWGRWIIYRLPGL